MGAKKPIAIGAAVLAVVACISCTTKQPDPNSPEVLLNPNRIKPRTDFEKSEDPPLKAKTLYAAGRLAESQQNYPQAVDDYWAAVKVEPTYRDPLFRLGVLHAQLQHYDEAIVAWKMYIKAANGDALGYSNLGFCCELAGREGEAETAYRSGIEKDPRSNPCRVNYGLMLARAGRIGEATVQLQAVLSQAEVHYNLASVFEHQGKKEQARAEYKQAIALDPRMEDARLRLAALEQ